MQKDYFYRQIGAEIKKRRIEKEMTQEILALRCGLHRAYIGHVERGEKKIGLFNLVRIIKVLDIDLDSVIPKEIN